MTPKEKADELFNNFYNHCFNPDGYRSDNEDNAVECALFCVDEILKALESDSIIYGSEYRFEETDYWQEVKNEINKL
tara:strand:+ start:580 stop:810 length:231 start_codon:yes stop_codon:yes gene_type:complete